MESDLETVCNYLDTIFDKLEPDLLYKQSAAYEVLDYDAKEWYSIDYALTGSIQVLTINILLSDPTKIEIWGYGSQSFDLVQPESTNKILGFLEHEIDCYKSAYELILS